MELPVHGNDEIAGSFNRMSVGPCQGDEDAEEVRLAPSGASMPNRLLLRRSPRRAPRRAAYEETFLAG